MLNLASVFSILTRLAKIGALKVISRTSTQKYKSAPDNLREIGNQLGADRNARRDLAKAASYGERGREIVDGATS